MKTSGYSKVSTRIRAYVRPAAAGDQLPLPQDNPALLDAETPADLDSAQLSKPLADFLRGLDAKMDTVISLLSQKRLEDDFQTAVDVVEIGGEGLTFLCESQHAVDDVLEFALILNQYPLRVAAAIGTVRQVDQDGPVRCKVEFTNIRETDFEAVMRFVFHEERQRIRESKRQP